MDNDVQGTEYCIGFSTAITRAKEAINRQRTTLGSPRADRRVPDLRARRRVLRAVHGLRDVGPLRHPGGALRPRRAGRRSSPRTTATTPAATPSSSPPRARSGRAARCQEVGEADAFGHRHKANIGEALAAEIKARTGIETVASELTYDLRSRRARLARLDGRDHLRQRRHGPDRRRRDAAAWSAIQDGKYAHTPLPDPALGPRKVDVRVDVQRRALPAALRRASSATRCCSSASTVGHRAG